MEAGIGVTFASDLLGGLPARARAVEVRSGDRPTSMPAGRRGESVLCVEGFENSRSGTQQWSREMTVPIARTKDGRNVYMGWDKQLWVWGTDGCQKTVANIGQAAGWLRKNCKSSKKLGQFMLMAEVYERVRSKQMGHLKNTKGYLGDTRRPRIPADVGREMVQGG